MVRIASTLLLALCAAVANAQDFASVPELAALPAAPDVDPNANANAFFVNDVNAPVAPAAANDNGFGIGLPESRAAIADYAAPQLVAPHPDALPQPYFPQNGVAADLTNAAGAPHPVAVAAMDAPDAMRSATEDGPHPVAVAAMAAPTEARSAADTAPHPVAVAAMAAPGEAPVEAQPHPVAVVAMAAPVEARSAVDAQPHPVAVAAMPAPNAVPVAADAQPQPIAVAATVAPVAVIETVNAGVVASPLTAPVVDSKATNFKSGDEAATEDDSSSGSHIATFAAVGAACVLAVAAVVIARKRKNLKQKNAKTPGTPKNELTFFHVQSRLTPPAV